MSNLAIWSSRADWLTWEHDDSGEFPRIVGTTVKLPYLRVRHIGTGDPGEDYDDPTLPVAGEVIGRYRFGTFWLSSDDTARLNRMSIGTPSESDHKIIHATNVEQRSETSEYGFNSPGVNSHGVMGDESDFRYPRAGLNFYAACWVQSFVTEYEKTAYILYVQRNNGTMDYAIFINTDGYFCASVRGVGTLVSSIPVDTDWHYIMLVSNAPGAASLHSLYIDNELAASTTATATATGAGETTVFSIGANERDSTEGFMGYIDELTISKWSGAFTYVPSYRHETVIFRSPVIDTENNKNVLSKIRAKFETPDNSTITFSFRASNDAFDQDDTDLSWTGFTGATQVQDDVEVDLPELGLNLQGRYHQVRVKLAPSLESTYVLRAESPALEYLEAAFITGTEILQPSHAAYIPGVVLGQTVNATGTTHVDKVSLNLSVNRSRPYDLITASNDVISFQASVWQEARSSITWQPALHFTGDTQWNSHGTPITNTNQTEDYTLEDDIVEEAPYLRYRIFFNLPGVYDLWGYGYSESGSLYWNFDDDTSDMRELRLGQEISGMIGIPRWTHFGHFEVQEAGTEHSFYVYLGQNADVVLDQWYFTQDRTLESQFNTIDEEDGYLSPLPLTRSPFMTAVRIRSLDNGATVSIANAPTESGSVNITMWLPSGSIKASGLFNYEVPSPGADFIDGLSIEYWQIGGSNEHYASWDYGFVDDGGVGDSFRSEDFGETIE